jgi:[acyl-carrier-protein] S-malonyltransferase
VKPDVVEGICTDAAQGEVVGIANLNSEMQIVIAGHRSAVERAVALAKERGGRKSVLLPVSAPFHCALMAPAGERLAPDLAALKIADPAIPVVRNVDAGVTRTAADVVPFLLRQIANPVQWTACVERLAAEGADRFVEVGPGRVLTGLVKRIVPDARALSVEDPAGLDRALEALAAA